MKKTFLACALALGMLTMSSAQADSCCYGPQFDSCCCGPDFNGFYVGGNVGAISHTAHRNDIDGFLSAFLNPAATPLIFSPSGFTTVNTGWEAGLQIGYDWQCCNKVFGVVWDWDWADTHHRDSHCRSVSSTFCRRHHRNEWLTTVRARAGLAVCDSLVYVTLGGAWAGGRDRWWINSDNVGRCNHKRHSAGWVGGVGAEFLVWCNWSVGVEVLYVQFDRRNHRVLATVGEVTNGVAAPAQTLPFRFSRSDSLWLGRVLLNYRFGDLFGSLL